MGGIFNGLFTAAEVEAEVTTDALSKNAAEAGVADDISDLSPMSIEDRDLTIDAPFTADQWVEAKNGDGNPF